MGGETHTAEVLVQEFHVSVDQLQCDQLVVLAFNGAAEIEAGVSEEGARETQLGAGFWTLELQAQPAHRPEVLQVYQRVQRLTNTLSMSTLQKHTRCTSSPFCSLTHLVGLSINRSQFTGSEPEEAEGGVSVWGKWVWCVFGKVGVVLSMADETGRVTHGGQVSLQGVCKRPCQKTKQETVISSFLFLRHNLTVQP